MVGGCALFGLTEGGSVLIITAKGVKDAGLPTEWMDEFFDIETATHNDWIAHLLGVPRVVRLRVWKDCHQLAVLQNAQGRTLLGRLIELNLIPRTSMLGWKLSGMDLSGADFSNADLRNADLSDTDLRGANFTATDMRGAKLDGSLCEGATFRQTNFCGARLQAACLGACRLFQTRLIGADGKRADLRRVRITHSFMFRIDLRGADLREATIIGADARQAKLGSAKLDGSTFEDCRFDDTQVPQKGRVLLEEKLAIFRNLLGDGVFGKLITCWATHDWLKFPKEYAQWHDTLRVSSVAQIEAWVEDMKSNANEAWYTPKTALLSLHRFVYGGAEN